MSIAIEEKLMENKDMSVCSIHRTKDPDCPICKAKIWEVLNIAEDEWNAIQARAEEAGTYKCLHCGFEYYKTIDLCPLCGINMGED